MALADQSLTPQVRPRCGMGLLIATISDQDRDTLEVWLGDSTVTSRSIADALRAEYGETAPSDFTVNRHRRYACRCGHP